MPHFIDRAKPGVIAVMRNGARFANEGNSYHDFVQEMMKAAKPGEEIAAFLICDHRSLRKYGLGCVPPFPMPIGHHLAPAISCAAIRSRRLPPRPASMPQGLEATVSAVQCIAAADRIPLSARDRAPTTGSRAMPCTDRTLASRRSSADPSTRSRW